MAKKSVAVVAVTEELDVEPVSEALEAPSEPVAEAAGVNTYLVQDGDSYASVAARLKPAGVKSHDYAQHLYTLNGSQPLLAGRSIKL